MFFCSAFAKESLTKFLSTLDILVCLFVSKEWNLIFKSCLSHSMCFAWKKEKTNSFVRDELFVWAVEHKYVRYHTNNLLVQISPELFSKLFRPDPLVGDVLMYYYSLIVHLKLQKTNPRIDYFVNNFFIYHHLGHLIFTEVPLCLSQHIDSEEIWIKVSNYLIANGITLSQILTCGIQSNNEFIIRWMEVVIHDLTFQDEHLYAAVRSGNYKTYLSIYNFLERSTWCHFLNLFKCLCQIKTQDNDALQILTHLSENFAYDDFSFAYFVRFLTETDNVELAISLFNMRKDHKVCFYAHVLTAFCNHNYKMARWLWIESNSCDFDQWNAKTFRLTLKQFCNSKQTLTVEMWTHFFNTLQLCTDETIIEKYNQHLMHAAFQHQCLSLLQYCRQVCQPPRRWPSCKSWQQHKLHLKKIKNPEKIKLMRAWIKDQLGTEMTNELYPIESYFED